MSRFKSKDFASFWFVLQVVNASFFQDPKVYVNTILEVHKKYNALVLVAFNNDSGFVAALDKACGRFINTNAVTRAANSSSKSPELLAKYCDLLLKKSSKNPEEAELEDTLNQVVSIICLRFCGHQISSNYNKISIIFAFFSVTQNIVYPLSQSVLYKQL